MSKTLVLGASFAEAGPDALALETKNGMARSSSSVGPSSKVAITQQRLS